MPLLLGVADEVPDDQKVARELHLLDHLDFAIQPLGILRQVVLQRALRRIASSRGRRFSNPFRATYSKYVSVVCSVGTSNRGNGSFTFSSLTWQRCAISQVRSSASSSFAEQLHHLVARLQVEIRRVPAHPVRVVEPLPRLDAHQDLVRARIVLPQVVRIVGRHQRKPVSLDSRINSGVSRLSCSR